ncbi:MAG: DUF1580 domain-containing protein [Planctomycetota bacterium]|jgi:hypothetical protein|nr:MAG: DUF1580 domain-containing protein [Planctomycetota bacterium]
MQIDLTNETPIRLSQAKNKFFGDKPVSIATLHRWRLRGVRGTKLETFLSGGSRMTTLEAIARFLANQNKVESSEPAISKKQRQIMAETANRLLAEAGI